MNKLGLTIYMAVGVALVITGFATTERGLKESDRNQIYKVAEDYEELGDLGFKGFCPLDYKIAFSNGEKDRVVVYNDGSLDITEREAAYEGLVASVYQNGDEFEVVVPEYDTWTTLESMNGQALSSVIWHESFHAYQNTHFELMEKIGTDILSETELAAQVDTDAELKRLFSKELEILSSAENAENTSDLQKIAIEYMSVSNERDALLNDAQKASENFYEMMEGSAFYVESLAVQLENGQQAFEKDYLDVASKYAEGGAKYYRLGMLQCRLLDKLDPDWKNAYSFDCSFDEVILGYLAE
jgi:hypothetical protein